MTDHFCPEGLPSTPGDVVLTELETKIVRVVMEQIIAGNDVSVYAEEAQVVLNGIVGQGREMR